MENTNSPMLSPAEVFKANVQLEIKQRIEDELGRIFPTAKILRMDLDTTMSRMAHETKFRDFAQGKYQIMVGTQMVAKGLNFPQVTLVGVLGADQAIY